MIEQKIESLVVVGEGHRGEIDLHLGVSHLAQEAVQMSPYDQFARHRALDHLLRSDLSPNDNSEEGIDYGANRCYDPREILLGRYALENPNHTFLVLD